MSQKPAIKGGRDCVRQVCIVTGGSHGIGRAIIRELLRTAHDNPHVMTRVVYNLDIQTPPDREQGEDNTDLMAFSSPHLHYRLVNVARADELTEQLVDIWRLEQSRLRKENEHLHVCFVSNAGVFESTENRNVLWDAATTSTQVDTILQTNLGSVIHGTQTMVQLAKSDPTSTVTIINMASIAAFGPFPQHPVYAATKAAVLSFTRTCQLDLEGSSVNAYAVCPGIIDTAMGRMGGAVNAAAVAKLKGGKRTSPRLVAEAVAGLVANKYKNSSYLIVDNHEIATVERF